MEINANGSIRRMRHGAILLNLFPGNEAEGGPTNIYLRLLGDEVKAVPLLGPRSQASVRRNKRSLTLQGHWRGVRFVVTLNLAAPAPAWFWHLALENTTDDEVKTLDLIYVQDLALADYSAVRLNEYYISQYVDHAPLCDPKRGLVLAARQNLAMGGRNPWCVIGSLEQGVSFATDALQVHGLATRGGDASAGIIEGLPGKRLQHEHSMAAVQDAQFRLKPGQRTKRGFFGWFEEDHPAATSSADLAFVDRALALPEAAPIRSGRRSNASPPAPSRFSTAPLLNALNLTDGEIVKLFGADLRQADRKNGRLLSFFVGDRSHVALKAKELQVLRPHGHILRTGAGLTPDEAALTSTVYMAGVFHSMVTQGHVSINRFLSTTHSYLGLFRSHGQRLFVDIGDGWLLLDTPSAFEIAPEACRWYYKYDAGLIWIESRAETARHELQLSIEALSGPPLRCLLSNHIALGGDDGADEGAVHYAQDGEGVLVRPSPKCDMGRRFPNGGFRIDPMPVAGIERVAGDEALFADGFSRNQPFLCLITKPVTSIAFRITGCLTPSVEASGLESAEYWAGMTAGLRLHTPLRSPLAGDAAGLMEILPWFAQNALIHYLAPRGLEQYSGGGWGTRDVCQGPVEMLLALKRFEPLRDLLLRVFRQQNPDGDWPQWFMFFERERNIRAGDSHGDIVYWPLLALAQYLLASEDASILDEIAPFFTERDELAERTTIKQHVERALRVVRDRLIDGTNLPSYGHGDWNDSLQPVDPAMRERLCSAWTATLHFQTLTTLARAFQRLGLVEAVTDLLTLAEQVRANFQRLLIVDDTLAGLARFNGNGRIDHLLHPRDASTGISFSLLAIVHAITNDLFTPEQAQNHLEIIDRHLLGPDGARLFDWPMEYYGGLQRHFQRAESSSFFGREIGLMYTHAHLRYAEALWRHGDAEKFFRALCLANPLGVCNLVPTATPRQVNCYYSSSDAAFADRYEAYEEYDQVMRGAVPLDGGWRIYSSGAGISLSLILRCFLGLQQGKSALVLDPVVPRALDGLRAELEIFGHAFEVTYRVENSGSGPTAVQLNGANLRFTRGENPYRTGAAEVQRTELEANMARKLNRLTICLS